MATVEVAAPVAAAAPAADSVESQVQEQGVEGLAQGMEGMNMEQSQGQGHMPVSESELHRYCAEGNLEGVRACLTASLEALETLGCTPMVLAIRANSYDVVRELLSAGAIVPPPGLTNDPGMLSILYPPHMYGMPPFMPQHGANGNMQGPPEFYPQASGGPMYGQQQQGNGQFWQAERMYMGEGAPGHFGQPQGFQGQGFGNGHQHPGHGHGHGHNGRDRQNSRAESSGQLPPVEVAKMIPCRNFPQCKYGNSCAFYHPNRGPFFAQGQGQGYEQYPAYQYQGQAQHGYAPQEGGAQEVIQESALESTEGAAPTDETAQAASTDAQTQQDPTTSQAQAQPFVPAFQPTQPFVTLSNRRQSFNQFAQPQPGQMMPGKPYGHGKKPSFSGGPRPFAPRADYGKWKDGMPPPCAFFVQGKCRNGEMCKFPHIDAEGNDCRHPDIIKGLIAPMPPAGRRAARTSFGYPPSAPMGMNMNPSFDPVQRQQQLAFLQQQRAAVQNAQTSGSATPANAEAAAVDGSPTEQSADKDAAPVSSTPSPSNDDTTTGTSMGDSQTLVASTSDLAGKDAKASSVAEVTPAAPTPAAATTAGPPATANLPAKPQPAATPAVARSASQPGMPRPGQAQNQARGPFGNPAARRAGAGPRGFANGPNGAQHGNVNGRSASAEGQVRQNGTHRNGANVQASQAGNKAAGATKQKVPGADDFPALGGVGQGSVHASPVMPGRTAAQVLSDPAPVKVVKEEPKVEENKEVTEVKDSVDKADDEIEMDSDNESDGVIITCKPSTSTTAPASGAASPVKKAAPLSFASIAGALGGASTSTSAGQAESAPVAVKA